MNTEFIELVVATDNEGYGAGLFKCRAWSGIKPGDKIVYQTVDGDKELTVLYGDTVLADGDACKLALALMECKSLEKLNTVKAVLRREEIKYGDNTLCDEGEW